MQRICSCVATFLYENSVTQTLYIFVAAFFETLVLALGTKLHADASFLVDI